MKRINAYVAAVIFTLWGGVAHASTQDISAIDGYIHAVTVGENGYDADHATMMHALFSVVGGAHPTNRYLRSLISQTENDLTKLKMLQAPRLSNATAEDFLQSAAIYTQAYAANADKILQQFFSVGQNYSIQSYMRDSAIEDAKGSGYTQKAIKDMRMSLESEGIRRGQVYAIMKRAAR
jgi:hypothetical protein